MAQLTVDLSGQTGLAPTFAGDLNDISSQPQLRYVGATGQLADGVFDPLRVQGYMCPANNTYIALTGTITNKFVSAEYSASADTLYLGQNGPVLSTISGLDATSITNTTTLTGQSVFRDLELYQINGQESLFYSYLYANSSVTNQTGIAVGYKSVDSTKGQFQLTAKVYETGTTLAIEGIANGTAGGGSQNYNRQKLSQKFVTSDFTMSNDPVISGVRLRLLVPYPTTTQTWTLKVGIQTDSGGYPSGTYISNASTTVAASTLPTGAIQSVSNATGDYAYVWFEFPTTTTLSTSTTYHIVIEPTIAASTLGNNEGVIWLMSDVAGTEYAGGAAEWNTVGITTSVDSTSDIFTITTPTTLAAAGIIQGTNLKYTGVDYGGLVQNTTYYVGSISGETFKLYSDIHLSTVVDITGSASGVTFDLVASYPNITFDAISGSVTGAPGTSLTFNSAATGTLTDGMAIVYTACSNIATSVTWGGVAMTKVGGGYTGPNGEIGTIWMLANPGSGVKSIVISWSGSANATAHAITYANVLSTLSLDASNFATGDSNVGDISIANTSVASACLDILIKQSNSNYTASTNSTERGSANSWDALSEQIYDSNTPVPAGSYTMTITRNGGGTGSGSRLIFSIKPAATAQINANGYWNSQSSSYDFAVVLNQYDKLIGPTTVLPYNTFIEGNDTNVFLHSAQNGFLYLFTGNRVSKFDGGDTGGDAGTFTADVLTFPSYITTVDAVDTNSLVYIGIEDSHLQSPEYRTFPTNTIGVYSWDYQSILSTIRSYYPAPGARNIRRLFLNTDGQLRVITTGEDGFAEIRGLNGGQYQVIYKMGRNSHPVNRDSFGYMNNMVTWVGADGYQYLFGKIRPDSNEMLYKIGNLNTIATGTLTPGVISIGNKTSTQSRDGMFISYDDTGPTANKLVHWYPHGVGTISSVAQTGNIGNVYTLALRFPSSASVTGSIDPVTLAKVNYIRVYHAPVGSSGSTVMGTISTYLNQSTTPVRVDNVTASDIVKGYMYINVGQALLSGVFMVQFKITWSTATTLSTGSDWMPRLIEMNYDEVTKRF